MLNSQSAIVAVRRYSPPGLASRAAPHDRCDNSPEQLTPTTESSEAEPKSLPATRPATAEADATWPSAFWSFLEGFALYGASLHGLATTAVTTITGEVGARRPQEFPRRERRKSISLVSSSSCADITVLEREDAIDRTAFGTRIGPPRLAGHDLARHRKPMGEVASRARGQGGRRRPGAIRRADVAGYGNSPSIADRADREKWPGLLI